jgi:hypothetical protein
MHVETSLDTFFLSTPSILLALLEDSTLPLTNKSTTLPCSLDNTIVSSIVPPSYFQIYFDGNKYNIVAGDGCVLIDPNKNKIVFSLIL